MLVWADDSASGLHANFKLSSAGEFFALVEANGSSIVDSVTFPALSADYSWGRAVDATGNWVQFSPATTTPASSNQSTSVGVVDDVFSNIKVLNGGANHCMLEYNCSSSGSVVLAWYNALGQTLFWGLAKSHIPLEFSAQPRWVKTRDKIYPIQWCAED
jgi:hypothetical protein